ncbi:MAG: cytochrome c oxidase subunit I [Candidatus Tokpelaia sp. JSC189]|nr:MAG: cytochrome c oxidase subunit I [Candidatus Tokpelaia sp. JSC189]
MKSRETGEASTALHNRKAVGNQISVVLSKILSSDHKNIGTFYFIFAIFAGIIGIVLSLLVRMEVDEAWSIVYHSVFAVFSEDVATQAFVSEKKLLSLFNSIHALVMIVFIVLPALFCSFSNWLVPLLIGIGDMAYPWLNRAGFWLFLLAFIFFIAALFCLPENFMTAIGLIIALHIAAISVVISAINLIVTIIVMRVPAVKFSDMPAFVWAVLIASFFMLLCMPLMTVATTLLLYGYALQMQNGVLYTLAQIQVMLWFFSHPEIYVSLLSAFGIISHIIAVFFRNPLYAQKGISIAMTVIGLAGFILWTQNLFHDAGPADMQTYFLYSLSLISLPSAFIVFSWFATIRCRWRDLEAPMLWAAGFMFIFVMGTISTLYFGLSRAFCDLPIVFVSNFHYVLLLSCVFAIFAGWYFWFPIISGFIIRDLTSRIHFWVMFVAVNLISLPKPFQGFAYESQSFSVPVTAFSSWVRLSTVGTVVAAGSLGIFLYAIAEALIRRRPADKAMKRRFLSHRNSSRRVLVNRNLSGD